MLKTGHNNDYEATAAIFFFLFLSTQAITRVWLMRRYDA